jgi:hypothetical protein
MVQPCCATGSRREQAADRRSNSDIPADLAGGNRHQPQNAHWPGGQCPVADLAAFTCCATTASADTRVDARPTRLTEHDVLLCARQSAAWLFA